MVTEVGEDTEHDVAEEGDDLVFLLAAVDDVEEWRYEISQHDQRLYAELTVTQLLSGRRAHITSPHIYNIK